MTDGALTRMLAALDKTEAGRAAIILIQGDHGSLLSPATSARATVEMQTQMAAMLATGGTQVPVTDTSVIRTQ